MTSDLTDRQRQVLDAADSSSDGATERDLDLLLELTRDRDSDVRLEAARAISTIADNDCSRLLPVIASPVDADHR